MKNSNVLSTMGLSLTVLAAAIGMIISASCDVKAASKPKKMTVTPSSKALGQSKTLYIGGPKKLKTTVLKVKVTPSKASKSVTFHSSNVKVAAVSKKGKVTAKKAGKVSIVAVSNSNSSVKKKIKITVKKYTAPKMKVKTNKTVIYTGTGSGAKAQIKASISGVMPSKKVTYSSSDKDLATVSSKGVVTANKKGETGLVTITVKSAKKTYKNKSLRKYVDIEVEDATEKTLTKTGVTPYPETSLKGIISSKTNDTKVTWSSSDEVVAKVNQKGVVTGLASGQAVITAKASDGKTAECTITVKKSTVAVHDPSIFKDPNSNNYYTIGTNVSMAVSADLQAWSTVTSGTSLFKNGMDELQPLFDYTGERNIGQVWAADLIYNTSMKKYCMYVCAAATGFKTIIGMFSSDKVTGPYEYKGILVCADFNKTTVGKTNVAEALGLSDAGQIPARYYDSAETGTSGSAYYKSNFPDAIDPAPFYGHDGNLYMTYGSFTCHGGIHILKLNPKTGLRDKAYNYDYKEGESDPYFGKKITNKAGEGPYILKVPSDKSKTGYYYYLWTSSGVLRGTGNYTMSMWRSENPDGPFVDAGGTAATDGGGNVVCYNYKYSFMKYAHTSMGGNSALYDDGKIYLTYHNKFSDDSADPGRHMVKVHQMFVNEDGWPVMTPFDYHGETIANSYKKEDVAGNYELIIHRQSTTTYVGKYNYNISVPLRLKEDGTLVGALSGKWELSGNRLTVTAGDAVYKGVVAEQYEDDGTNVSTSSYNKTIVFTVLGGNRVSITGTKVTGTDEEAVKADNARVGIPEKSATDFVLQQIGLAGSDITWESNNTDAVKIEGDTAKVVRLDHDTTVTLTATVKRGSVQAKKECKILIPAFEIVLPTTVTSQITLELPKNSVQGNAITWTSSHPQIIDAQTGVVTIPDTLVKVTLTAKYGDVTRTFDIRVGELKTKTVFEQDYEKAGITTGNAGWTTHTALTGEIVKDAGNAFAKFTSTGSGPRSGLQNFNLSSGSLTSTYVVETDFFVTTATYSGSGQPTTQIALVSQSNAVPGTDNKLADSEYIVDLRATGMSSDKFTINGEAEKTVTIPADTWCHMEATVNQEEKQVFLKITNKNGDEMYSGTFAIKGDTKVKGIYILNGRGGTITQFDNTAVKITE